MNTLQSNSLQVHIKSWNGYKTVLNSFSNDTSYPIEIEGVQGSLCSFFAAFCEEKLGKNIVVVVPGEREAQALSTDLSSILTDIPVYTLPWWGASPYRSVPKGAAVFGQRASVLSKLAYSQNNLQEKGIFIVTQRALQTPVPKPEYIKSLLFLISKGDAFDPVTLAERLVKQGYTRVPRVSVRGEFTLRGEVLDIFMPGEQYAHRIVFDFDSVEQIKLFDPETQSSVSSLNQILVYPMKEIIWTDELIQSLENKIKTFDFYEEFKDNIETFLTELMTIRESEGEEFFYQELFEKKYSIFDYLDNSIPVFFFDYDRLCNGQEVLEREYLGLYRKK